MKPMKIYAFVEYYPSAYKAYYDTLFADLVRKGHDLHIFALGRLDSIVDGKVTEYALDRRTRYFYADDLRSMPRFLPQIMTALAKAPHLRLSIARRALAAGKGRSGAKNALKALARMLTLPSGPPDVCIVNSHCTMALLPWLRNIYPAAPVALYYYGGEPKESGTLDVQRTRAAFAAADMTFTLTQFARAEAIDRGADPERAYVVPIGFDVEDYRPPNPRHYRRDGVLRLVTAGRLSEGKGHLLALEAISRLVRSGMRDLEYRIIGNGYMRPRLDDFVLRHGLGNYVRFDGTLANRTLITALGEADALVLSSMKEGNWTETQGAVVQEALLMKALAVTTQTGGVPESIPEVMRPFSVPENDVDALTAVLRHVYELADDDFECVGDRGRSWAASRYDISRLTEQLLQHIGRENKIRQ